MLFFFYSMQLIFTNEKYISRLPKCFSASQVFTLLLWTDFAQFRFELDDGFFGQLKLVLELNDLLGHLIPTVLNTLQSLGFPLVEIGLVLVCIKGQATCGGEKGVYVLE